MRKWLNEHFPPPYRFLSTLVVVVLADILDLYERFSEHASKLLDYWQVKVLAGSSLSLVLSFHETEYAYIAQGIFWLVILDIITKWFAISYQYLIEQGMEAEKITTMDKFRGWVPAFRAGKLNTSHMGFGFVSKMVQFALLLTAATMIDTAFANSNVVLPMRAITFMVGFICYSEFMSIVENMRDSGVSHMNTLMDILSSNILNKLKK